MDLKCNICFHKFDLGHHRPKSLPCGHTICKECLANPGLGKKCPTCRKNLPANPGTLPDNVLVVQIIEGAPPPSKVARTEDPRVQQLQCGVEAGRKLVEELRKSVPEAIKALNLLVNVSANHLYVMEEALEQLQQEAAGGADINPSPFLMRLAVQEEDRFRLLTTTTCSLVAVEGEDSWRASVELGQSDHVFRLLLQQLRMDGQLQKVDDANPTALSSYMGPPRISVLSIDDEADLDDEGDLKVDDILRNGRRWKHVRSVRNLSGRGSEKLLRVVAPHLEELEMSGPVGPGVMEEVKEMKLLRRLIVEYDEDYSVYPDLPVHLEELSLICPVLNQFQSMRHLTKLRSLNIEYSRNAPAVSFNRPLFCEPLWLGVSFHLGQRNTALSMIRAFAPKLQGLQIYCSTTRENADRDFYFPDLGPDLAACGLNALRQLVLERPHSVCSQVDVCLLQMQTIRGFLPSSVTVLCDICHRSVL
ncbi:uncharacterized protein LOC113217169 [Frankliniella occidentalis]|uniref:Uncharacterized protein LOC113217169 n=1 Tax=Frankliniella occidentalis TaxID=133901 RepID=A0A6J1TPX2_FRAOC|nr:uncharacterized protein LOC113217169 [Frankliniella occidentalis]XP_026292795.2 uncharacterized protein LOC113217169 [Frankliniella occidentalis]